MGSQGNADFLGASILTSLTRQKCRNLFIGMDFRGKFIEWKDLPSNWLLERQHHRLGPSFYPTDFGACCLFVPHVDFEGLKNVENLTYGDQYHGLNANALNGETNGLRLLLDVEQFNYAKHNKVAGGLQLVLHHHSDKPMIQFSSQLISTGIETHINVKPTISYTTNNAISMLAPEDRDCYTDGEANLNFLSYADGYKYEMNNCLIDEMIGNIIWQCGCVPSYFEGKWISLGFSLEEIKQFSCQHEELDCAIEFMESKKNMTEKRDYVLPETLKKLNEIYPIPKPTSIKCLPACETQENTNQMSFALYPQKDNFFHQRRFCQVASHIWQVTCQYKDRKYFLDLQQPKLCQTLEYFDEYFNDNSTCDKWPNDFLEAFKKPNGTLLEEMVEYGRKNLAVVKVMMQSPYVTKMKRDVAMTFTSYVANSGGLLGLCLGFSLISGIELIFWFFCCCRTFKEKVPCSCEVHTTTKRIKKKTTGDSF